MVTWKLHTTFRKDGSVNEGIWDYCADPECTQEHMDYQPFHAMPMAGVGRIVE